MNLQKRKYHQGNLQKHYPNIDLNLHMVFFGRGKLILFLVFLVDVVKNIVKRKFITGICESNDHVNEVEHISTNVDDV